MSSYAMNDQDILLLPFRRRVGKYSLKQVEMMNLTANMFVYANTHMRHHIWRLLSPEVYASFLDRVFPVTQMLTSLLSVSIVFLVLGHFEERKGGREFRFASRQYRSACGLHVSSEAVDSRSG
eukprot:gene28202-37106_t